MLPWLFLQGFLASILASLACYYLALFPLKISCIGRRDANFRPSLHSYSPLATASVISSASITNTRVEEEEDTSTNSTNGSSCQPLLWYSVIMILSLLILVYYFYIVQVRNWKIPDFEPYFPHFLSLFFKRSENYFNFRIFWVN